MGELQNSCLLVSVIFFILLSPSAVAASNNTITFKNATDGQAEAKNGTNPKISVTPAPDHMQHSALDTANASLALFRDFKQRKVLETFGELVEHVKKLVGPMFDSPEKVKAACTKVEQLKQKFDALKEDLDPPAMIKPPTIQVAAPGPPPPPPVSGGPPRPPPPPGGSGGRPPAGPGGSAPAGPGMPSSAAGPGTPPSADGTASPSPPSGSTPTTPMPGGSPPTTTAAAAAPTTTQAAATTTTTAGRHAKYVLKDQGKWPKGKARAVTPTKKVLRMKLTKHQ